MMIFYPPFVERTPELVAAYETIYKLKAKLEMEE
tara:strand:+ start:121 stop:222 length:102 start_codon:yes stop_codon:yes gene_type:complete